MKSKLIFNSLMAISFFFLSCKKEETESKIETVSTNTTQQPIIVPNVQPIPTETYVQPNQQQINMPVQNTPQMVTQTPVKTKPGMNPPHGQAGHRCDIAVGAPLNSPVTKPTQSATIKGQPAITQTTTPTPTETPATETPALLKTDTPTATAPGMNPPHGQEGHRCDIAVGQPLSK